MNFSLIFSLAALVFVLLCAGVTLLIARRHGWIMAVVRAGTTLLTAVLSVPLAKLIADKVAGALAGGVLPKLGGAIADIMTKVPVAEEGAEVLVALILTPVIYLFLFAILRGLLGIVLMILEKKLPILKKQETGPLKITLPVGAANGLLVAIAALIPVCGLLALGGTALDTLTQPDMVNTSFVQTTVIKTAKSSEAKLKTLADDMGRNPAVVAVHKTVGKPMFKWMTTGDLDVTKTHNVAVKMNLETELCSLLEVAGHGTEMLDIINSKDHRENDQERLVALADTLLESTWVKLVATDLMVELGEAWQNDEPFAGKNPPAMNSDLEPTFDTLWGVLANENYNTIEDDLHVIVDVIGEVVEADLFSTQADYRDLVSKLGQGTLLTDVTAKLQSNERLAPVAVELKAMSMRLVTKMLGVEDLQSGKHDKLVGNVASSLTNAMTLPEEERREVILDSVKTSFGDSGYDVPDDVAVDISNQIIDELGADGEITQEELKNYMVEHAGDTELLDKVEKK